MDLYNFIRSYLSVALISKLIERMPKRKSVIYDEVFVARNNNPSAYIRVDDIVQAIGSVPVVTRDGVAVNVSNGSMTQGLIEPMPIRLRDFLSAARLNDLKALYGNGGKRGQRLVQSEIDRIITKLMKNTQKTRDALCAQALTGTIDYQMLVNGAYIRYKISFGDMLSYAPAKKWDADATKIGDILAQFIEIRKRLHATGHSGDIGYMAASDAWVALANKITALPNEERLGARVNDNIIDLAGFKIMLNDGSYSDRDSQGALVVKDEVEAKKLVAWIRDVPQLEYCAVDDIDGNLEAVPFFAKPIKSANPSGVEVVSESKPMPLIGKESVLWATVLQ